MKLTRPEIATALAALRLWQQIRRAGDHPAMTADLLAISTDGDTLKPITPDETEALIERLNFSNEEDSTPETGAALALVLKEAEQIKGFWTDRFASVVEQAYAVLTAKQPGDEADDPAKPTFEFVGFNKVRYSCGALPARVRVTYPDGEVSLLWMDEKMIRQNLNQMGGREAELEKALACFVAPDRALEEKPELKPVDQAAPAAAPVEELD